MSYNTMNRKPMSIDHLLNSPVSKNGLRHHDDSEGSDTSVRTARSTTRTARTNSMGRLPRMYTAESFYEINNLPVTFDKKSNIYVNRAAPRMHTADSLYEFAAIPNCFGNTSASVKKNKRAHSAESKEYLKTIPSLERVRSSTFIDENQPGEHGKNYNNYNFKNYSTASNNSGLSASDYAYLASDMKPKHFHVAPNSPCLSAIRANVLRRHEFASPSPYKSMPQFTNYNYCAYENAPVAALSFAGSDTNTAYLIAEMPDVFSNSASNNCNYGMVKPTAPLTETLNKRVFGDKSLRDLDELAVSFTDKMGELARPSYGGSCLETLNKRLLTQESIMDLNALPPMASQSEFGKQVMRDYCIESLEDVRLLPSFSSMSLNNEESNVKTARAIISNDKLVYFPECHN